MGDSTSINLRIDKSLKKQAEELFESFGLNMTSAINMFLKQAVREQSIPFKITSNDTYNFNVQNSLKVSESGNTAAYFSATDVKSSLTDIFKEAIAENIIAPPHLNADLMTDDVLHEKLATGIKEALEGRTVEADTFFSKFEKEHNL